MSSNQKIKNIIEAALLAASKPLSLDNLLNLFLHDEKPDRKELRSAIEELQQEFAERSIELVEVGSGFRIHVRSEFVPWVSRLWEERPPRYSRALLETLALIAYRQPITRGEIEDVRGVSVSSSIIKTLIERDWIRVVGHRDVPGKPSLLATTKEFLDYFGMKGLGELPTLAEIKDLDSFYGELDLEVDAEENADTAEDIESDDNATETLDEPAAVAEQSADETATDEVNEKEVEVVKELEEQPNLSEQHGG
jgi:segregation and condensation protein B